MKNIIEHKLVEQVFFTVLKLYRLIGQIIFWYIT